MREIDRKDIRKVIIVSKTHLDIGFTDYADAVMGRHVKDYIPRKPLRSRIRWIGTERSGSSGQRVRT